MSPFPANSAYELEREPESAQGALLARDRSGRRVTLKRLDDDCLLDGQLHPVIRDRLLRVQGLAHLGVANLLGVESIGEDVYMVWEFVEGRTLQEVLESAHEGQSRPAALARRLVRSVESLHALGIVHGALHPRNIIVASSGAIKLIHVSPLLHNDDRVDIEAMARILDLMGFEGLLDRAGGTLSFREINAQIERQSRPDPITPPESVPADSESPDQIARSHRRVALVGAALAALIGAAVAFGVWKLTRSDGAIP